MALKYPDRIESNNPQAYGIVKATEVSGAKNAAEYGGLLSLPDNILSTNGDGSDALYLLWIDDNSVYRLVDWNNRHNDKGWQIEYAYIPWDSTAHLNSFTLSGQYYISGQSNGLNGGLPILNSNPGHTFDAVLRVLDSSLTKDTDLKLLCITLILSLSNRMGGDGHIFVRTIQTLEKDNLTRTDIESPTCDKWSSWEKLLGIIEKNVVEQPVHLNTYTTNGMYSGVFVNPDKVGDLQIKAFDTFLLITVNGYAAADLAGRAGFSKTPQLTQLLYITPIETGLAVLYTRTATWDGSLWVFDKFYRLATNEDTDRLNTEIARVKNTTKEVTDNIRNLALFQFTINPTENNVRFVTSNLEDVIVGGVDMLPASTTLAGVMSAADKIKLDSVERTATAASTAAQEAKSAAETAQSTATAAQTIAQEAKETAEDSKKIKEYKLLHSHTFTEDATSSDYELLTADDGTPIHQYKDILILAELSYVKDGRIMTIYLNISKDPRGRISNIASRDFSTNYVFKLKIDGLNTTLYSENHTNSFYNGQYSDGNQGVNLIGIRTSVFTYDRLTINFPFKANDKILIYGR